VAPSSKNSAFGSFLVAGFFLVALAVGFFLVTLAAAVFLGAAFLGAAFLGAAFLVVLVVVIAFLGLGAAGAGSTAGVVGFGVRFGRVEAAVFTTAFFAAMFVVDTFGCSVSVPVRIMVL